MAAPIPYDSDNVFKKIIEGKIPCYKVAIRNSHLISQIFETEDVIAILDAFPTVRGHALLIPKVSGFVAFQILFLRLRYATVEDLPAELAAKVFAQLPRLIKAVRVSCQYVLISLPSGSYKC
jgi:histidine triad (HIT) family protein